MISHMFCLYSSDVQFENCSMIYQRFGGGLEPWENVVDRYRLHHCLFGGKQQTVWIKIYFKFNFKEARFSQYHPALKRNDCEIFHQTPVNMISWFVDKSSKTRMCISHSLQWHTKACKRNACNGHHSVHWFNVVFFCALYLQANLNGVRDGIARM